MATYDNGDTVRFSAAFADVDGAAADPTTVSFRLRSPSATTTYTYAGGDITKDSTGNYHIDVNLNASGSWYARWVSTGTPALADESSIFVRRSHVS